MYVHTDCVICQEVRSNMCRKGECPLSARDQLKMCRPNLHYLHNEGVVPMLIFDYGGKSTPECVKIFSVQLGKPKP